MKLSQQLSTTTRETRTQRQLQEGNKRKEQLYNQQVSEYGRQQQLQTDYDKTKEQLSNIKTLEEYQRVYSAIKPELKQYFTNPQEIINEQQANIQTEKQKIVDRRNEITQKMASLQVAMANATDGQSSIALRKAYILATVEESALEGAEQKIDEGYNASDIFSYAEGRIAQKEGAKGRIERAKANLQKEITKQAGLGNIPFYSGTKIIGFAPPTYSTLQPKGTYIPPKGEGYGISISQENLEKGLSSGKIEGGGTYKSLKGEFYKYSIETEEVNEALNIEGGKPVSEIQPAPTLKSKLINAIKTEISKELPFLKNLNKLTKPQPTVIYDLDTGVASYSETGGASKLKEFSKTNKQYKQILEYGEPAVSTISVFTGAVMYYPEKVMSKYYDIGSFKEDTSTSMKVYRGGLSFVKTGALFTNPVTGYPAGAYFGVDIAQKGLKDPFGFIADTASYLRQEPYEFAGGILGGIVGTKVSGRIGGRIGNEKYTEIKEVPSLIKEQIPYAGRGKTGGRATLLILDETGTKVGLGKNPVTGEYISAGGKPEAGETIKQAVLRETKEELGLKENDFEFIKKFDEYGNPEETQLTYLGKLKKGAIKKIKPASDISKFDWFDVNAFKGIRGATQKNIFSYNYGGILGLGSKKVRVTEAVLLERYRLITNIDKSLLKEPTFNVEKYLKEEGGLPTELKIKTKTGEKIYVGMESRYDVSSEVLKKYLAKGKKYGYKNKNIKFDINTFDVNYGYLTEKSLLKVTERTGKKPYNIPQILVHGTQNKLFASERSLLGNIKEMEIMGGKTIRGGSTTLLVQPPKMPSSQGYLGASYVLKGGYEDISFSLFPKYESRNILYGKSVIDRSIFEKGILKRNSLIKQGYKGRILVNKLQDYLNKISKPNKVIPTAKTLLGIESEFGYSEGTVLKFSPKDRIKINLEGKTVNVRKVVKARGIEGKELKELYNKLEGTSGLKKKILEKKIKKLSGITSEDLSAPKFNIGLFESSSFTSKINKQNRRLLNKENIKQIKEKVLFTKEVDILKENVFSIKSKLKPFKEPTIKRFREENLIIKEREFMPFKEKPFSYKNEIPKQIREKYAPKEKPTKYIYKEPYIEKPTKVPTYLITELPSLKSKLRKKRHRGELFTEELGLTPDFTAKVLGIDPKTFEVKDVGRAVRQIQTGFNIRTGGRIKRMNEKEILKMAMRQM